MDRGTWRATVHQITKSWTLLKWLSTHTHILPGALVSGVTDPTCLRIQHHFTALTFLDPLVGLYSTDTLLETSFLGFHDVLALPSFSFYASPPIPAPSQSLWMSFMYSFRIDVLLYTPLFLHHCFPVVPNPTYILVVLKSTFPGGWSYSITTARRDLL